MNEMAGQGSDIQRIILLDHMARYLLDLDPRCFQDGTMSENEKNGNGRSGIGWLENVNMSGSGRGGQGVKILCS
jgi:hypothetical protein